MQFLVLTHTNMQTASLAPLFLTCSKTKEAAAQNAGSIEEHYT